MWKRRAGLQSGMEKVETIQTIHCETLSWRETLTSALSGSTPVNIVRYSIHVV